MKDFETHALKLRAVAGSLKTEVTECARGIAMTAAVTAGNLPLASLSQYVPFDGEGMSKLDILMDDLIDKAVMLAYTGFRPQSDENHALDEEPNGSLVSIPPVEAETTEEAPAAKRKGRNREKVNANPTEDVTPVRMADDASKSVSPENEGSESAAPNEVPAKAEHEAPEPVPAEKVEGGSVESEEDPVEEKADEPEAVSAADTSSSPKPPVSDTAEVDAEAGALSELAKAEQVVLVFADMPKKKREAILRSNIRLYEGKPLAEVKRHMPSFLEVFVRDAGTTRSIVPPEVEAAAKILLQNKPGA